MPRLDAVIVGGGVIGLSAAWRASQRGLRVRVLERAAPGAGASRAAAGVLAPDPQTPGFTALARASAERWRAFAHELGDVGYERCGSLVLRFGGDDVAFAGEPLTAAQVRRLEPGVAADCTGGVLLREDAQVDPRRVVAALASLLGDAVAVGADVAAVDEGGATLRDGTRVEAGRVVLAAGAWAAQELAPDLPVVPVKGQTIRLAGPPPAARIVRSEHVYVVPRAKRETVVGATIERAGFDDAPRREATESLLRQVVRALPAAAALEVVEQSAGLRPGTPDDAPLLGDWNGVLVAGGHYRNGVLLAPITAEFVAATLAGEPPPPETRPFSPGRFAPGSDPGLTPL
ncbi:MAG TPA: FAD-dependent oxidoreductase [Gaiellaceae bacterium]|nr:FAD-dependent oxidoreductase [Gaiellaceae bacterium]